MLSGMVHDIIDFNKIDSKDFIANPKTFRL